MAVLTGPVPSLRRCRLRTAARLLAIALLGALFAAVFSSTVSFVSIPWVRSSRQLEQRFVITRHAEAGAKTVESQTEAEAAAKTIELQTEAEAKTVESQTEAEAEAKTAESQNEAKSNELDGLFNPGAKAEAKTIDMSRWAFKSEAEAQGPQTSPSESSEDLSEEYYGVPQQSSEGLAVGGSDWIKDLVGVEDEEEEEEEEAEEVIDGPSIAVVIGGKRIRVPCGPESTTAEIAQSISDRTKIPVDQFALKMGTGAPLKDSGKRIADYGEDGKPLDVLWVEVGPAEESLANQVITFLQKDTVSALGLLLVFYEFYKDLWPLLVNGLPMDPALRYD
eukprot:TRINITY_DN6849_c1_g1_i1.p1 TRINITY_DN6849_c1_g1~~TRINITY_DN6849_c1_g1_i1.p1  ORF type:complete len:335 (-),score=77.86 TRINITY_DN6849_c1_g1_i1:87-1091(-)